MMLGFLLARAGVDVVVLEKHADFLRDFRGDTVHPATLDLMFELGLLDEFLQRPHTEVPRVGGRINGRDVTIGDLTYLPTRCKFIALMPQWDFLNFLAEHARRYPAFSLRMRTAATDLIDDGGRIAGVRAHGPDGPLDIRADLVIAADGRHSVLRERAGLRVRDYGAPFDVLWFRLPKRAGDAVSLLGYFERGRLLVTLDRGDYWQCAYVIPKGGFDALRARDIAVLHDGVVALAPFLRDRIGQLTSWDDVKLLTVVVDRLETWHRAGLLCIGDAAHAMSPMGGVGINFAIQDAVAAANMLAAPLASGTVTDANLAAVQRRRELPTRIIQAVQVAVGNRIFGNVGAEPPSPGASASDRAGIPLPLRLLQRFPWLRQFPARLVGIGPRPEHIRTPDVLAARAPRG